MFVNVSNHNSQNWSDKQLLAAKVYGDIINIGFPHIAPYASKEEIDKLAEEWMNKILKIDKDNNITVMIQGEFSFTYQLINKCKKNNIRVVTSCTDRKAKEYTDEQGITHKESLFEFIQFREY